MKTFKSSLITAGVAAFSLMTMNVQAATSGNSEYVSNVDISFPGYAAVINVKNTSLDKHVSKVQLAAKESSIDIEADGYVKCGDNKKISFKEAKIYFGPLSMFVNDINDSAALYQDDFIVGYSERIGMGKWITESSNGPHVFNVPLNQIKNGHPAIRVDAVDEINKKLQTHLQGGGTKAEFYQNDQEVVLQRPVSLAGWCRKYIDPGYSPSQAGFETKNFTIQIKYKGDPQIDDTPLLNAQLQGNMPNQVQAGQQPFKFHNAEFMANIPHHFGKCVPDQNPVLRVNYQISGDKQGEMDFRINSYSNQYADYGVYYEHLGVVKNPKLAGNNHHFDFEFPLKEMLSQQQYSWMAIANNKTHNHNMVLQVRYRPQFGQMGQWQDVDTATFKHRCVPQLSGQLGGQGPGGIQGYDNGGPTPPAINGKIQAKPMPKPMGIKAPSPEPTPKPMGIRAPLPEPSPKPLDKAAPVPSPTPKPMGIRAPLPEPSPKPLEIKTIELEPVEKPKRQTP